MSKDYLREIDLLSIWEVAHRWLELDPDKTNREELPEVLTDKMRKLLSVLGSDLKLYDETADLEYERSLPPEDVEINHEAHQRAHRIMLKRQYPKDDLDSLYITRYDVRRWCMNTFDYLPEFWFKDNEIEKHNQFLYQCIQLALPTDKRLRKDQETKITCQNLAIKLWKENTTINISQMARHAQIIEICTIDTKTFANKTICDWLREIAPPHIKGKPGRPKNTT